MPESPESQPKSFRELVEALPAPIAIVDPAKWDEYPVFREIFVSTELNEKRAAATRAFGMALQVMGSASGEIWQGSYSDVRAMNLAAVVADLRCLQGYLDFAGTIGVGPHQSSRDVRWCRSAKRFAKKVAGLADEIEREVEAGYQQDDM
jgi:hypothetical protein